MIWGITWQVITGYDLGHHIASDYGASTANGNIYRVLPNGRAIAWTSTISEENYRVLPSDRAIIKASTVSDENYRVLPSGGAIARVSISGKNY